jgi:hypothetical protein
MTDEPPSYLQRRILFTQLPEDVREMETRLRAAYPEMRFVSIPVCRRGGTPELIYLDSLLDNRAPGARLYGWIEPEGWEPQFGYPADETVTDLSEVLCMNVPEISFLTPPLERIRERFVYRSLADNPAQLTLQRMHHLDHRVLICWYRREDTEAKRFAGKVLRLAVKDADRTCFAVDHRTGLAQKRPYYTMIWFAKHARAWVRASPDRFFEHDVRPGDDPEDYRWDLPPVGDLCLLPLPEEDRPKPGLLYDENLRRRRVLLVGSVALPKPDTSR